MIESQWLRNTGSHGAATVSESHTPVAPPCGDTVKFNGVAPAPSGPGINSHEGVSTPATSVKLIFLPDEIARFIHWSSVVHWYWPILGSIEFQPITNTSPSTPDTLSESVTLFA